MSNCSNCGEPLRNGARFCAKCGQPVSLSASSEIKNEPTNSSAQASSSEKPDENSGGGCGCLIIIIVIGIIYKIFF